MPGHQLIRAIPVAILVGIAAVLFVVSGGTAAPIVTTDKADYYSGETVTVTGSGFAPNTSYDVPVIRPDGSIVHGDGSFTPGWDTVVSDGSGDFTYLYQLNGIFGTYEVRVYNTPWSGNLSDSPVATVTFTDADIDFTQCRNDNNNDNVKNACAWTTGGLNGNNAIYMEGDGVPQRLIHRVSSAGTYTFTLEYDFSRGDIYAYDFLTNVDETQSGALLNECGDLPPFVSAAQCSAMFTTNAQLGAIPSDAFDSVSSRENPPGAAARNIRVGCSPACAAGVTVAFPDAPIGPSDGEAGEAHVPDSDPDCFKDCGTSVAMVTVTVTTQSSNTRVGLWFAGHLAESNDPSGSAIGWGTGCSGPSIGCGASSISGAPFHLRYTCLKEPSSSTCDSVGNRDNQMQIDAVVVPGSITIIKDAVPDDAQDFSFTGSLGGFSLDDDANGTLSNTVVFSEQAPSTYTVTESPIPGGWNLASINCSDPDNGTTVNVGTGTASIDLDEGEDITCTFTNELTAADVKITSQDETAPSSVQAGQDFNLQIDKTLHNNGPTTPVDVSITPTIMAPPDCTVTPAGGNPTSATLALSSAVNVTENFTVNCTEPSAHVFNVDNCIAVTTAGISDPNTSNNCWPQQQVNVTVLDQSDIKLNSVTVDSPVSADSGVSFPVSASATLHNNGGHGPTNVDTSFTLSLPAGCSTGDANPTTAQDTNLPTSAATATSQVTWNVTCNNPSNHQFNVAASATIDELHVSDPTPGNNNGNGSDTTPVLSTADVKVSGVTVDAPVSANAGATFPVTVTATLHNNGTVTPVNADATIGLSGPADCTLTPTGGQTVSDASLAQSVGQNFQATWDVSCTNPSNHQFNGTASVSVDQQHVSDGTPGNNSNGGNDTTAITATADLKVSGVTVDAPASASAGASFPVTVTATLHNNGTATPVNADGSIGLSGPADCTLTPTGGQTVGDASLAQSAGQNFQATWDVSCTNPSNHQFDGMASVSVDQQHVSDGTPGNNSNSGNDTTAITAQSDIKANSVTVTAPASANAGASFSVSASANLHNNGGYGPANVDTTFTLNLPGDCNTADTNPVTVQDTSLPTSSATNTSQVSWNVSCDDPSNHQFSVSAAAAVDQTHVSDPNTGNNSSNGNDIVAINDTTDLKVSGVTVDAPVSANAGATFPVTVTATLHNNGPVTPVNADATIGLSGPGDCTLTPTGGQSVSNASLALSVGQNFQATWDVSCTSPSNHQFDGTASVSVDQQHVIDPTVGNDSNGSNDTTAISATADLKVTSVTVDAPTSEAPGNTFAVTVSATLHNNGNATPVNADATLGLSGPADCTLTPTGGQDQQDLGLAQSAGANVQATWDVSCTNASNHQFDGTASITVDQLHVTDGTPANNSNGGNDTTAISATADVKVSSVVVAAPAAEDASTTFEVTVTANVHNNGNVSPVNTDTTISLSGPGDCTLTPTGGQTHADVALAQSAATPLAATWDVECTDASNHQFDGSASIAVDQLHVTDGTPGNNSGAGDDTTVIGGEADLKVSSVVVDAPASAGVGAIFPITVTATVHNNGTESPANADVTIDLSGPGDCILTPTGGQSQQDQSLAQSAATPLVATWNANCSSPSNHQFDGSATITLDSLHLADPNTLNNSGSGDDTTTVTQSADVKVNSVTVDAPASENVGTPFNVTVTAQVHNNGSASSAGVSTQLDLSVPVGCSRSPNNSQSVADTLAQSVQTPAQAVWSVTCNNPSNHQFNGSATISVTQLHVNDPNGGDNSGNGSDTTTVLGNADLKVSSVTVDAQATAAVGATFPVTVTATVHNNGSASPVNSDTTIGLSGPADCTLTPTGGQTHADVGLAQSAATPLVATWDVECTDASNHQFDGSASIALDQLHVADGTPANNSANGNDTTAVTTSADIKVQSVSVDSQATANAGSPFNVDASATLHNNGGFGPTNVDTTLTLTLPGDCTTGSPNPVTVENTSLAVSSPTVVGGPAVWSVTCTNPSNHLFSVSAAASIDQLHVTDPSTGNNSATGNDTTAIETTADLKVTDVGLTLPQMTAGVPFDIDIDGTIHNNGPYGPIDIDDLTITLGLPADCSTGDTNPVSGPGPSLAVSVATAVGPETWTVTCTDPGSHAFSATVAIGYTELHLVDPNLANNEDSVIISNEVDPPDTPTPSPTGPTPTPGPAGGTPNPVGGVAGLVEGPGAGAPVSGAGADGGSAALTATAIAAGIIGIAAGALWAWRRTQPD